jgi:hypothetical protein
MSASSLNKRTLKTAMKEALVEALSEQRELLHEVIAEALEDFALTEAIRAGRKTKLIPRDQVMRALSSKS